MMSYPLNSAQFGVYLECIENRESVKYNIPVICRLPDGIDIARFKEAILKVIGYHETFKATFAMENGVPTMYIGDKAPKLVERNIDDLDSECRAFIRPFDYENGPLCRFEIWHYGDSSAFLFDVHHLIFDGTSLNLFVRQIADCYDGKEIESEILTLMDVAQKEQEPKDLEKVKEYQDFFSEKLGTIDCDSKPVRDVLIDGVESGFPSFYTPVGDKFSLADVDSFIKANQVTENALFLSAFGYTLAKFNGMNESFFTTGYTGRYTKDLRNTVGMFVRTLPFACAFTEDMAPADLVKVAYDDFYKIKQNTYVPFGEIATEYGIDMSVSFVYQAGILNEFSMSAGNIFPERLETNDPVDDLELMFIKLDDGYTVQTFYNPAVYTEGFAKSFTRAYINVALGMISCAKLGDIQLTDAESFAEITEFNKTEVPYENEKTVVEQFREQAQKTPDNNCVVYCDNKYTYREIDEITDRLARHLTSLGIGKGSIVGVLIPRCEYMVICSLAVLKTGGAYLPLDPSYPPERLNLMMNDAEASLLFTTPDLCDIITDDFTGPRIMVDDIPSIEDCDATLTAPDKDDLFIMLYTSGSTGTPKGVMFAHSNTMVTAAWERRFYALGPGDNNTAYASYGFDANVFDTYATITSGATLHIISDDIRLDLIALQKYFNENNITHSTMTTQVGRQFALMEGTKTLRYLNVAGEKLTPFEPRLDYDVFNLYGPTEGSILATGFKIDKYYKDVPIGKAIDNVKLYVVDPLGRLQPTGAAGELWISGAHVTMGYKNRPEKTAEAYGLNPFCNDEGYDKVYRTGDIVRLMSDGNIQFIGRRDGQVKVRGFRVELTEIEEIVRRFPGIKDATCAAFDEPSGGKFVAAYVVSDDKVDIEKLNEFILEEKPPYMVPAVTMQIDKIPLNQNQKVNKRALPKPERKIENIVMPENDTQQKIYDIVADVIGHNEFGVDTNLFMVGLTSIGTLKLNVALGTEFDITVKLDDLKQNDTVRKLEALVLGSDAATTYEKMSDYPISQTQQGIFVECNMNPGTTIYNMPILMKLDSKIDTDKLVSAIKTAIKAHSYAMATLFADGNGDIRAKRNDDLEPTVLVETVDELPSELVKPFDLLSDPLYRIAIYKTADANYLFMDFHHIVSDGTSEAILLQDIDKAYKGENVEPEKYTGFEVALEEEKLRATDKLQKAHQFYDSIFLGCETNCLPPKTPECDEPKSGTIKKVCGNAQIVNEFCDKNKVTPNAFFNAAFGLTFSKFIQFDDVVFTTIYNGRSDSRLASTLSMLVKTIPVLVSTEKDKGILELINETKEQLIGSMSNDIFSFAEVSSTYGIKSDIIFAYQGDDFTFDTLCGEKAELLDVTPGVAKAPITLNVYVKDGKYEFVADYKCDMYSKEFIDSLLSS
ncbi:MAG: amino acid adenylation domain-containing protein, partial [Clostridia bacterium]|nr:amino acid adenylation domain-containing protein [Clostridia bacterium]